MPLQKQILQTAYKSFFEEINQAEEALSLDNCIDRLLTPYHRYAQTGQDPSGDTLLSSSFNIAKNVLETELKAEQKEQAFKDALATYWMGATFKVAIPHATMSQETTSVVTSVNPAILSGIFLQNYDTVDQALNNMVNKMHAFTKTVTILITGLAKAGSPPPTITAVGTLT